MDDMKATKLIINLKEGIIQAEGGEDFVREVYNDFKEVVSKRTFNPSPPPPAAIEQIPAADDESESQRAPAVPAKGKVRRHASGGKGSIDSAFKPKFDPDLDLTGINVFYAEYSPTNNSEKILVFAAFLRDRLGKPTCTAHEIYTCYFTTKEKTPTAFVQAFRDCQSRTHYIKYSNMSDIEVTIHGNNWLNAQTKKNTAAE